jgi:hypothetical protein
VNINRGAHGGPVPRPSWARHTIGANIGYGEGVGPGGYKYCLFLVNLATRYTWVYGLSDLTRESLVDALWRFFVDAGGFPKRFRCDFHRWFLQGKVGRLLRSHGVKIGASPPIVTPKMVQLNATGTLRLRWVGLSWPKPICPSSTGSGLLGRPPFV